MDGTSAATQPLPDSVPKKHQKPDFFLQSIANEALRIPVTQEKLRIGRYTCQFNDNRLSRNQAEVWSDGKHCFFRQIGVNPCAIKPSGCVVGIVAEGAKSSSDGEIALAHVPPDVRGCVRTAGNLIYVLEENFVIYMLATSEADLAPFRLVLAAKKNKLPPMPKPSPATSLSRNNSVASQDAAGGSQMAAISLSQESDMEIMSSTPTKRIKLTDVPAPSVAIDAADTQMMLDMAPQPPNPHNAGGQAPPDDSPEAQLAAILPQIPLPVIRRALAELNNDVQEATEALLLNPDKYMQPDDVVAEEAPASAPPSASAAKSAPSMPISPSYQEAAKRPQIPPPSQPHPSKSAANNVDLVEDDDEIDLQEDEYEMALAQSLRESESQQQAVAQSLQDSQHAIDELQRRLQEEEQDRMLAQKLYEEEERRIKQMEDEKKRAAEFDSSIEAVKAEVARQHLEKLAEMERERQNLLRLLEEEKARKAQVEAGAVSPSGPAYHEAFPDTWDPSVFSQHEYATFELSPLSQEFQHIARQFLQSCGNLRVAVRSIKRNQNKRLWKWYSLKRDEMAKDNPQLGPGEAWLFHGTNPANIGIILRDGLDMRVANMGGAIGAGIYFAEQSHVSIGYVRQSQAIHAAPVSVGRKKKGSYAMQAFNAFGAFGTFGGNPGGFANPQYGNASGQIQVGADEIYNVECVEVDETVGFMLHGSSLQGVQLGPDNSLPILYCRVALGHHVPGSAGLRRPPNRPNSTKLYDSVTGQLQGSKTFCIFDNNQSYPEYIIYYQMC